MSERRQRVAIVGGGLVGSLLSVYLSRRGYHVWVFDRRSDPRNLTSEEGRSINLALSTRGIKALEEVVLDKDIGRLAIPMHGRMMHDKMGRLSFQPYGRKGQYINSISRADLNILLIDKAEQADVQFLFEHRCIGVNLEKTCITLQTDRLIETMDFDFIIGADGAFSAVRSAMQVTDRFEYSQHYLAHGYKELTIPPDKDGKHAIEKNALHIWPRESFMMIALPNVDGSFTCTLFLPFEGKSSFASLDDPAGVQAFFREEFPDAVELMGDLAADYARHPTSSLVTIRCFPWVIKNALLIGDAAHAIVPFYGQGMNAGFEDCRMLNGLLTKYHENWPEAARAFQSLRKKDSDAIAQLAYDNFLEMRDLVADPEFLLRKKIEAKLHELYPDKWIPLYSMVTFHDLITYSEALAMGKKQETIMDDVMRQPQIAARWEQLDFGAIVRRLS